LRKEARRAGREGPAAGVARRCATIVAGRKHELLHFVDDETKDRWNLDAPHGHRDGAMRLSHEQ